MELVIDVTKLAEDDYLGICKDNKPIYKRCSRYLGFLTQKIKTFLLAGGYKQVSTTSSLTKVMFLYQNKAGVFRKIKNSLAKRTQTATLATVSVELEDKRAVIEMEALFKNIKIPSRFVHVIN